MNLRLHTQKSKIQKKQLFGDCHQEWRKISSREQYIKPEMHVLPSIYVFSVKKDVGSKLRIVAKSFCKVHGVEYNETYAAVVIFTHREYSVQPFPSSSLTVTK